MKRALLLFVGGVVGVYAVLPHLGQHVPEFVVYVVVVAAATVVGTYLLPRTRLQVGASLPAIASAIGVGLVTAIVLVALGRLLFTTSAASPPLWTGLLYALYGGVTEEVVFHFGLLTALVWLAVRVAPEAPSYWIAVAVSAAALGLSHLPTAEAVILTALGAAVSGWLYWRRGLVAAMAAHAVIGFALHVGVPGAFVVPG